MPRATERQVPAPVATPDATPQPAASPAGAPAPLPSASPTSVPASAPATDGRPWWWALPAAALVAGIGGWAWRRRRRDEVVEDGGWVEAELAEEAMPPAPLPADVAVAATDRPRLSLALRPTRAGVNLLSATVEAEVTVANAGSRSADDVRVEARLISAHERQDAELAAIWAEPVSRAAGAPFALAPGEERRLRIVAALRHDHIKAMTAAGRPMFVPVVAVQARYAVAPGVEGQTAAAFAVGVERAGSAKLAPLWLDQPARMHDQVAARAHGAVVER